MRTYVAPTPRPSNTDVVLALPRKLNSERRTHHFVCGNLVSGMLAPKTRQLRPTRTTSGRSLRLIGRLDYLVADCRRSLIIALLKIQCEEVSGER